MPSISALATPAYPDDLETWWLRRLQAHTGIRDPARGLPKIEADIRALSDTFTKNRADQFLSSYATPAARVAYGVFFFPQSHVRTATVVDELIHVHGWSLSSTGTRRILDLGAGLGAAALAAARHPGLDHPRLEITTVEADAGNQTLQKQLFRELLPRSVRLHEHLGDFRDLPMWAPKRTHRWDLILVSFALNEAFQFQSPDETADWLNQAAAHLTPEGLLVVLEPALKETATKLEAVRDALLTRNQGLHVWAPCLHRQPCPARSNGRFWCHEARRWTPPESLKILNRSLHREIETLKFSFLALGRVPPPGGSAAEDCRMVSPVSQSPGRYCFHGCTAGGKIGHYDLLTRHLDATAKKTWWATERGTILRGQHVQVLGGESQYRILPPIPPAPSL